MSTLAITGGTGFVGSRLIDLALAAGHEVRALNRRPQAKRERLAWVEGALDTPEPLDRLVASADAVIHVAGVVNATDRAGFAAGNIAGTQAMVDAASRAGVCRFVHVSSLAARDPGLSDYGWSKAEAEHVVTGSDLDWTMVRPPGIYGPGDMEVRDLFRMAKSGIAFLPPSGRASWIEVGDIAALLLVLGTSGSGRVILEPDDGRVGGWSHVEFIRAIGQAVGRKPLAITLPKAALALGARADRLFRGRGAKLTPDRASYLCHPDWTVDPAHRPQPELWTPAVATPAGLAATAAWYRANGLL